MLAGAGYEGDSAQSSYRDLDNIIDIDDPSSTIHHPSSTIHHPSSTSHHPSSIFSQSTTLLLRGLDNSVSIDAIEKAIADECGVFVVTDFNDKTSMCLPLSPPLPRPLPLPLSPSLSLSLFSSPSSLSPSLPLSSPPSLSLSLSFVFLWWGVMIY